MLSRSVFHYLQVKNSTIINQQINKDETAFQRSKIEDKRNKDNNLQMFRPNLENPANKEMTIELNDEEQKRCQEFQDVSSHHFHLYFPFPSLSVFEIPLLTFLLSILLAY
jgi:hypothetical protein